MSFSHDKYTWPEYILHYMDIRKFEALPYYVDVRHTIVIGRR